MQTEPTKDRLHSVNRTVFVDTREQKCDHVTDWFDSNGIKWIRNKLYVGDYQLLTNSLRSVDRKRNLSELAGCMFAQHRRFVDEVIRAKEAGIILSILIEHGGDITSIESIRNWTNPMLRTKPNAVTGRDLMEATYRLHISYNTPIYFCRKQDTASEIIRILSE